MRNLHKYLSIALAGLLLASCSGERNIYSGEEYVMFADTLKTYPEGLRGNGAGETQGSDRFPAGGRSA